MHRTQVKTKTLHVTVRKHSPYNILRSLNSKLISANQTHTSTPKMLKKIPLHPDKLKKYYSGIHTPCPGVFWPRRHNLRYLAEILCFPNSMPLNCHKFENSGLKNKNFLYLNFL